jgi:hypothetical protein
VTAKDTLIPFQSFEMFIKMPDDAPTNYGMITKKVSKGRTSGIVYLPPTWIGGEVVIWHDGTYLDAKIAKANGTSGGVHVHKDIVGSDVIAFLITPP